MTTPASPTTELLLNPRFRAGRPYGAAERRVMSEDEAESAAADIRRWPHYRPTPEIEVPDLAAAFAIARLTVKHEGQRFAVGSFKVLGPPYAALQLVTSELQRRTGQAHIDSAEIIAGRHAAEAGHITLMAATSGNHGRAIAWAASRFGCNAAIYMRDGVSPGRAQAIAALGATVVRVPGTFDDALERCMADAERTGGFVVSDLPLPLYPDVPRHTLHGYSMLASELAQGWERDGRIPTHLFVAAGIGSLAAAVVGRLRQLLGRRGPRVIVVEPLAAAGILRSAEAGRLSPADGDLATVMDGLATRTVSPFSWTILDRGAFAFLAIPDEPALTALRHAARLDPPLVIGETGIAGLAGLLAICRDRSLRDRLGLDGEASVAVIASEGATDRALYEQLTGRKP
ncbi:MAG: diaminopropionate ammonia-lyase [Proteobacteria bacterium]|nr:diaminopropionate ammonia-lyase [Pseudomonadota bacterium]MBI3498041.1 diaminopropionate ammonia-lyase [Pseudomonadota bacterium]